VMPNTHLTADRREACEYMRLFLFGKIGNENSRRVRDRERTFYETTGTHEQVLELYKVWKTLDTDGSGRVDFTEFRSYLQAKRKEGSSQVDTIEKAMKVLLSKKSSFVIEDMIRICWPCAAFKDITKMKAIIEEAQTAKAVPAPPVLPGEELEALIENFQYYDSDGSGAVTIQELLDSGMLDPDTAQKNMELFDLDGSGELNVWEFCEMFCRPGFRAYAEAHTAIDDEGNRLYYDGMLGWRPLRANDRVDKGHADKKDAF